MGLMRSFNQETNTWQVMK